MIYKYLLRKYTYIHGECPFFEHLQPERHILHEARDESVPEGNCGNAQGQGIARPQIPNDKLIVQLVKGKELEEQNGLSLAPSHRIHVENGLWQKDDAINAIQIGHHASHHRGHPEQKGYGPHIALSVLQQIQFLRIGLDYQLLQICMSCAQHPDDA